MVYFCVKMRMLVICSMILVWVSAPLSHADIYKYVNDDGVTVFTNIPESSSYEKVITEVRRSSEGGASHYSHIIARKSSKYNIESSLIKAIISVESNWRPAAVSHKGAIGLMQLMPATIKDMSVFDPYDPEDNIEGGTRYLRFLLDRFDEDVELALAAYNAGPNRVEQYGGVPPIPETRKYVRQVLSLHNGGSGFRGSSKIYKVMNSNGTILYTNTPTRQQKINASRF